MQFKTRLFVEDLVQIFETYLAEARSSCDTSSIDLFQLRSTGAGRVEPGPKAHRRCGVGSWIHFEVSKDFNHGKLCGQILEV